ncbi:MAG: hypothetical protein AAGK23_02275 [Pseudomonadota bacterium]
MLQMMIETAQNPITPWVVLAGVGIVFLIEAWRVSHTALMGDLFADGMDD